MPKYEMFINGNDGETVIAAGEYDKAPMVRVRLVRERLFVWSDRKNPDKISSYAIDNPSPGDRLLWCNPSYWEIMPNGDYRKMSQNETEPLKAAYRDELYRHSD